MPPQHALHNPRTRVPEPHAAVFGARDDPGAVVGDSNGEDVVLQRELVSFRGESGEGKAEMNGPYAP